MIIVPAGGGSSSIKYIFKWGGQKMNEVDKVQKFDAPSKSWNSVEHIYNVLVIFPLLS